MPWCPKCKIEYLEGMKTCSDCQVNLVAELTEKDYTEKYEAGEPELLVTVTGEIEANRIEALLAVYQIPVMRKYDASGEAVKLITGNTSFGIELYVPSRLLKNALIILHMEDDAYDSAIISEEGNEAFGNDEDGGTDEIEDNEHTTDSPRLPEKNSNIPKSVIMALLAIAAAIAVIYLKRAF